MAHARELVPGGVGPLDRAAAVGVDDLVELVVRVVPAGEREAAVGGAGVAGSARGQGQRLAGEPALGVVGEADGVAGPEKVPATD